MTRVCVIGNSHTACFKLAWNTRKVRHPNFTLTFFAERGPGISDLAPDNGVLVPTTERLQRVIAHTSGGHTMIDLKDYDVVLLVGLNPGYPVALGYYSYAAACQTLLDHTPITVAFNLIGKIREISDIPIFLAHMPLLKHNEDLPGGEDPEPYHRLIKFLNDKLMRDAGATLLEQPTETITHCFYTKPEFAVGSTRLDVGTRASTLEQPEDQCSHMNKRYGDIYLSTHLRTIRA